jgi:hypothetical protein
VSLLSAQIESKLGHSQIIGETQMTNSGPVTLVYSWQRELQTESHQSTEAAITRASEFTDNPEVAGMFITEERAEPPRAVILNPAELRDECASRNAIL